MDIVFEVGQIVEVFDNTCGHFFEIGEKVRVRTVEPDGAVDSCEHLDRRDHWFLDNDDIRHLQGDFK